MGRLPSRPPRPVGLRLGARAGDGRELEAVRRGRVLGDEARELLPEHRPRDAGRRARAGRRAGVRPPGRCGARRRRAPGGARPAPAASPPQRGADAAHRRRDPRDAAPRRRDDRRRDRALLGRTSRSRTSPTGPRSRHERAPSRHRRGHRLRAGGAVRRRRPPGGDRPARVRPRRRAGRAGLAGVRHGRELGAGLRVHRRGDRPGRGRRVGHPRGRHHQHAGRHGALRQRRPRDLGLPERRLPRGGRGRRARGVR